MPIFESDKILKLFHGCDVDLRVLFSDLKLSVLNLLDTSKIDMALTKSPNAQSLEKLCK
jgi:ribonuclease D